MSTYFFFRFVLVATNLTEDPFDKHFLYFFCFRFRENVMTVKFEVH